MQKRQLLLVFDLFRDHLQPQLMSENDDRTGDGAPLDRETAMDWVTARLRVRGIPELPAEKLPCGQRGTDESERNQQLVLGKD